MMAASLRCVILLLAGVASPAMALAADVAPEIRRPPATPQAVGAEHTLRQIPEACVRLQGRFTGEADNPYVFETVPSSPTCQPRAKLAAFTPAIAQPASGWVLNDVIRVPRADCPAQQAVVRVWRKPAAAVPPSLDAQGRSRIYLEEAQAKAAAGRLAALPAYALEQAVEGRCGP